jgi:hypothetical protein
MSDTKTGVSAVLELQDAVRGYKAHGHGYFVWKAFLALPSAERFASTSPQFGPDVDQGRKVVMDALGEIAEAILGLGEVTTDAGRKQLLNAIKWAEKGNSSSSAREKEEDVVTRLRVIFSTLQNSSVEKLAQKDKHRESMELAPVWGQLKSFDGAFQLVADETGESKSNVRKIWETATSSGIGLLYASDAAAAIAKRKAEVMIGDRRKPRGRASMSKPVKPTHWR